MTSVGVCVRVCVRRWYRSTADSGVVKVQRYTDRTPDKTSGEAFNALASWRPEGVPGDARDTSLELWIFGNGLLVCCSGQWFSLGLISLRCSKNRAPEKSVYSAASTLISFKQGMTVAWDVTTHLTLKLCHTVLFRQGGGNIKIHERTFD